jgi:hypothetical protein
VMFKNNFPKLVLKLHLVLVHLPLSWTCNVL